MKRAGILLSALVCGAAIICIAIPDTVLHWFGYAPPPFYFTLFDPGLNPPDPAVPLRMCAAAVLFAIVFVWLCVAAKTRSPQDIPPCV